MVVMTSPSRLVCLVVFLISLSLSSGHAERLLSRHARAMMIDMRGFPDTEPFVCKGAGFQRNETDCTQFFRCVDFNNNGKHTIFRFMCGPMAVFDESRSLCTGPELSVPPCPKDQLDAFFVSMKPMDTNPPAPPAPVRPPVGPPQSTTTRPTTTSVATATVPVVTPAPATVPVATQAPVTIPAPVPTVPVPTQPPATAPPTTLASVPIVTQVPVTSPPATFAPVTIPVVTQAPPTAPPTTQQPITVPPATFAPATVPVVTQSPITVPVTTLSPVTIPITTLAPVTVPVVTQVPVTSAPVTVPVATQAPPTAPPTVPPVTIPIVTEAPGTAPPVTVPETTQAPLTVPATALPPVTVPITTQPFVTIPVVTQVPVTVPTITVAPETAPPVPITPSTSEVVITPAPQPETPSTPTPAPPVQPNVNEDIKGFITIVDKETVQNVQVTTITVSSGSTYAVVSQAGGTRVVIKEDGSSEKTFTVIPHGAILMINTTQNGGVWTNVANGLFTTSSTTTSFPPGTTFSIVKISTTGQIISWQTIITTTSTSVLTVPANSFVGSVQTFNQKIVTIGGWTFTTTYITTGTTTGSFGILQPSTTTTSSQTVITTTSTIISGDQQFISGILTVGGAKEPSQSGQDITIPGGGLLGVIPHGGQGIVTLIEEGSTTSTDFSITPGSFLGVLAPSSGVGIVTNVIQPMFTSTTTTITFPAGSTISVLKIGTDGTLIRISFVQISNSFTLFTSVQSIVGIVQTNSSGVINSIGTGSFTIQLLQGPTSNVYFGVVSLSPPSTSTTTQVESLSGIIQIGDSTFLNNQQSSPVQTVQVLPGTTSALLVSGEIKITEQDGSAVKQTAVSIPSGGILGIVTLVNGGEISEISNGYFTTASTQLIFPTGVRFGIVIIRPDGTMILQNPIDTTVKTTITVPVGSVFGLLTISNLGVVTGIGSASFTTQYLLLSDSTSPNVPATLGNFGVIYFSEQFKLPESTIINSAPALQQLSTISAIVQLGVKNSYNSINNLSVPSGSSFAIIPATGQGIVTVTENSGSSTFTVLPGQVLGLFNVQGATVTNIGDGFFTTSTTTISFGPGTTYGIVKIDLEGRIIPMEFAQTAQNIITITVVKGSTVGIIQQTGTPQQIADNQGVITSIGGASFAIRIINTANSTPQFSSHAGVLDIERFVTITVTDAPVPASPETTSAAVTNPPPTVAPVTIPAQVATPAPEVVTSATTTTTTAAPTTPPNPVVEDIKGFLTIGGKEVFETTQQVTTSTITVPSSSTYAVVSQGEGSRVVIKDDASSEKIFTVIPFGTILMINTTQNGGAVTNVANGLFTTSSTTTSFPPGTTFYIVKVGTTGQIINWQIIYTSKGTSVLTVPTNSFVGSVQFFNQKIVTIGGWTFTTTYITTGTTTNSFGVLQPSTTTTSSQTVITTTSTTITGDQEFISGIVTLGEPTEISQPAQDLTVPSDSLLAIIPQGGKGIVTLSESGSTTPTEFAISPGSFLGVLTPNNGVGTVTNLFQPMYTSSSTSITLPAGSILSVYRVGIDGKLVRISFVQITTSFTLITSLHSVVGLVQTSSSGSLMTIGTGSFSTQTLTGSSVTTYFGVLNLNPVETSQVESLSGILQVGDATFLNRQDTTLSGQTISIPAGSTSAVVASGDIQITEEDVNSSKATTFSIPSGGIFGMVTSTVGGEISGISSGYFTTSQTKIIFQSGVQIGIVNIRNDGTMILQNPIVTQVKTIITVPAGSTYGLIILSGENAVTGIGSASFTTQNLLMSDSTGPDVPAVLGNFGVMFFNEQFALSQSVVISSAQFTTQLQTISSIIQIGGKNQLSSVATLAVPAGSSFAIIPVKGQEVVMVDEGGSTFTFTILPGQIFGLLGVQQATVTDIADGFFTTSTTSLSFGAGTTYGVLKIGSDGSMISTEFSRKAEAKFTVTVASGSTVGVVQVVSGITSIGGASFVIRTLKTSSSTSQATVGLLDIAGFQSAQLTSTTAPVVSTTQFVPAPTPTTPRPLPASTPFPPTSGPFTIDCALNQLHQFPLDCSRFYQCFGDADERTVYIFPCAPGLIFDDATSQCLTPAEGVCDDLNSINDTASSSEGVGGFFQINCSGDLYRYPLNCNNFYQCFKDERGQETIFVFSCAAGLVFDEVSRTCLLPAETSSCAANDNLFRSPSIIFQLRQKIDVVSLISTSRTIVQQRVSSSSIVAEPSAIFSQPHQTGRGTTKRKMGYSDETRQTGSRQIVSGEPTRHAKESKSTLGNFRPRLFDSNNYGVRIAPRSKSLFGSAKVN